MVRLHGQYLHKNDMNDIAMKANITSEINAHILAGQLPFRSPEIAKRSPATPKKKAAKKLK
jgi:hypothetical protein